MSCSQSVVMVAIFVDWKMQILKRTLSTGSSLVCCSITSHSAIFQYKNYSDETVGQFPNLDLLMRNHAMGS